MRGLRLHDEVAKRDKKFPFSDEQLRAIFDAPLYRGCVDGNRGYGKRGGERPRNARFWVPLIGLYTGMRLNEICQLDVTDVRVIEGISCFVVTAASRLGSRDKSLKTGASERLVPIHRKLMDCGIMGHVDRQHRASSTKLFSDISPGTAAKRAVAFSKWFTQFVRGCGAHESRTCFHSFRHNFRDELRVARIDHDIAMALGGRASGAGHSVSESYGSRPRLSALAEAVGKLRFASVDIAHLRPASLPPP